jgi:uncharacterized protein GlcG (DUF336 family)
MNVTLARACEIVDAAVAAAHALEVAVAAIVLDSGGHFVAGQRMDGAYFSTFQIAERKAFTAVNFRTPTEAMRERLPAVDYQVLIATTDPRLTFLPGGVPVVQDGEVIGALGVSGGSGAQDIEICQVALGDGRRV